jgi:MOSC domain-containing protein YiiM
MPTVNVVSLHAIAKTEPYHTSVESLHFELDGIVGDRHRGFHRPAFNADDQRAGTLRRNERMWSAVSTEELHAISTAMDLDGELTPNDLTANLCFSGFGELSKLPKGSLLTFPSGLTLLVEEFCEPCLEKGQALQSRFATRSGRSIGPGAFGKAAAVRRGLVGIVERSGVARVGDTVDIKIYSHPRHLALNERSS